MNQLFFWNSWQTPYKQLYWGLLILFFSTIAFFFTSWIIGEDVTFPWETYAQSETVRITIDTINSGPFQLPFEVDNYLLTESFQGGNLTLYKWPSYLFVVILGIIFILAITCVTALSRFWYLVGMGLVIAFMMSLQLENLQLFGRFDKIALIGLFILYLPVSYYFQSINKNVSFSNRLIAFSLITSIVGLVIFFASEVQYPFLHLATYGYIAPVIISLLFILMIGHQILAGFIYIITSNNNSFSKNSLTHFLIITTVYLVNLVIIVLNEIQYLHWEFINVHPFALLLISSLIGFMLYSYQEEAYKHIYKFYPIGGFIYLMLGSLCFFTIGYHLFSANDAIIEVFEDIILYSHLGYGFIFLVYILANFLSPLGKNMQVHKVLYKPQNMPYFTYRFAGTIVVVAFLLVSNYNIPIFHTMSSYYNALGDLHMHKGEGKVAKVYYGKGKSLDYGNHRANYALGVMARNDDDNAKAAYHFSEAMRKRPTPQSFVNMGNIYLDEGKFFDGLFTIRDGVNKFPNSDRAKINLGLLYDKANETDSAYLTFTAARNQSLTEKSANVNVLSLISKGDYVYEVDSIVNQYLVDNHTAMIANGLAIYNTNQQYWDKSIVTDTILNLVTGNVLYNKAINNIYALDSGYLSSLLSIAMVSRNVGYREQLLLATALGYYYHLEVEKAFRLMDQLANNYPVKSGYYFYLLGLWSLDQEAPLLAVDFFKKSLNRDYPKANLAIAIAMMESGLVDEAKEQWETLSLDVDPLNRQMAEGALQIINQSELGQMTDAQKFWYWRYHVSKDNEVATQGVINEIADDNYKLQMHIDLMQYFLDQGDTAKVIYYSQFQTDSKNSALLQEWGWLNLAKQSLVNEVESAYNQSAIKSTIPKSQKLAITYYRAQYVASQNDTTLANELFVKVAANPFFEQGVIGKSEYLSGKGEQMDAYNVLLTALEVNPYAINLRKQYIMQCAAMDFDRYGDHALEELQPLLSSQEFYEFRSRYQMKLKQAQEAFDNFEDE